MLFSLIGYPLSHSFSPAYFREKFRKMGLVCYRYEIHPIEELESLRDWVASEPELRGFNVTIPHKEAILPLLDEVSPQALRIGAVNTVKVEQGRLLGFNTDYDGFRESLLGWLPEGEDPQAALVLGSGGASRAVRAVLQDLNVSYLLVSRSRKKGDLTYAQVDPELLRTHPLVIQATPLGMWPQTDRCPQLPYDALGPQNRLYDLVYNPPLTLFLKKGRQQGAQVKNGEEMLILQADRAWEIWEK